MHLELVVDLVVCIESNNSRYTNSFYVNKSNLNKSIDIIYGCILIVHSQREALKNTLGKHVTLQEHFHIFVYYKVYQIKYICS